MVISAGAAALGAGALSGLGSAIGGISAAKSSKSAARDAMQMQMDWEYLRAHNAHQWEMEDLKKAGLNPILAAGGSGATTGGISAVTPDTSGYAQAGQGLAQGVAQGINSAIDLKRAENETAQVGAAIDKIVSEIKLNEKSGGLTEAQTIAALKNADLITKQTAETAATTALKRQQTESEKATIQQKQLEIAYQTQVLEDRVQRAKMEMEQAKQKAIMLFHEGRKADAEAQIQEYYAKKKRWSFWSEQAESYTRSIGNIVGMATGISRAASASKAAQSKAVFSLE